MRQLAIILMLAMSCFSCGKATDNVPSVPVNYQAALGTPALSPLNVAGGTVVINGYGVAGLIIYRKINGTYAAYDRCSSYQPEKKCACTPDGTGFTVTDPCSGSKFSLEDGTPVKAPATKALRTYRVSVTQFEITVTN